MVVDEAAIARVIDHGSLDDLATLVELLSRWLTRAQVSLIRNAGRVPSATARWLPPIEIAKMMGLRNRKGEISARWLEDHWREIPGSRKVSRGKLLLSVEGVKTFMAAQ